MKYKYSLEVEVEDIVIVALVVVGGLIVAGAFVGFALAIA
jgi:hypothetical protein